MLGCSSVILLRRHQQKRKEDSVEPTKAWPQPRVNAASARMKKALKSGCSDKSTERIAQRLKKRQER
eukprot:6209369-Pleurochrysis_carterae.AAC.1